MRKWLFLACGLALQSLVFLACSEGDELQAPMIGDCAGCTPSVSGGGTSGAPGSNGLDAGATLDGAQPDAAFVDVGVTGNDVFGDTPGTVDVGASNSDAFPFF